VSFRWYFQPCSPLGGLDSSASPSPKIQSIPAYIESEGYCTDDDNDDDESSDNKNRKGVDDEYNNVSDDNGDDQQDVSAPNLPRCHQPIFVLSNISFSYNCESLERNKLASATKQNCGPWLGVVVEERAHHAASTTFLWSYRGHN
jgi:hypothetical protein